jgi:hypothetical protein
MLRANYSVILPDDEDRTFFRKNLRDVDGWEIGKSDSSCDLVGVREEAPGRWIVEAKGLPKAPQQRRKYFQTSIGQIAQAYDDENASYSLAFPDADTYRALWKRLPIQFKRKIGLTAFFVDLETQLVYEEEG